jgi:transposase
MRARIVLACAEGLNNAATAKKLQITGATVCKWRERFRVSRLEGLLDEPRPGAPRSIKDAQVEEVITRTLESMPVNSTHWSTRLMAEKTGLSQTAVVRIWRAFGLQPHRVENFKFSTGLWTKASSSRGQSEGFPDEFEVERLKERGILGDFFPQERDQI